MPGNRWELPRRRHLLLAGLFAGGALAVPAAKAADGNAQIHQEVDFAAPPAKIYAALLDEKTFASVTGAPATIGRGEGAAFSLFGGAIVGRNLELVPDRRVVQAWRDSAWKPGLYSVVKFELAAAGQGTHLAFDQGGYPLSDYASLTAGWPAHYWEPMKKHFLKSKS